MDVKFDENLMKELILSLELLNGNAPFRTKNVPNRTSGGQIMLRLVSISQYKRKIWSNQEIHFIDNSLWLKKDILNDEYCAKFNCSKDELNKIIQERYIEISKREWTLEEDRIFADYAPTKIRNKDLAQKFICRTINDVKKRRQYIKKLLPKKIRK